MENINGKKLNPSCCRKPSFYALSPLSLFPSQSPNVALIINCSISLSTGCLLVLIIAFHYKDIRVSLPSPLCFQQSGRQVPSEGLCVCMHRCIVDLQGSTCHIVCITFYTSYVCSKLKWSE